SLRGVAPPQRAGLYRRLPPGRGRRVGLAVAELQIRRALRRRAPRLRASGIPGQAWRPADVEGRRRIHVGAAAPPRVRDRIRSRCGAGSAAREDRGAARGVTPSPDSVALVARGVGKTYGRTTALGGVSLEVGHGELVGLLGPIGARKSTLTKIACGLVRPTSGTVEVGGRPAGSRTARGMIGYLAELFRFPRWMTADEVLVLHQRLAGSGGAASERAELLALVGLSAAASTRVQAMSKGMQQRLGIAQALVGGPRLLLLDEPTSAL